MGDPLKKLHDRMKEAGLLSEENVDYNNFVVNLSKDGAKQRLYEGLVQTKEVTSSFQEFDQFFFADYGNALSASQAVSQKKKGGSPDGGDASSIAQGAAPVADTGTSNQDAYADLFTGMGISDQALVDKIRNSRSKPAVTTSTEAPLVAAESTGVDTPLRQLPELNIAADQDPITEGTRIMSERDDDFEYKERRAARSGFRTADRSIRKIELYNEKADEQTRFANFHMSEKFGEDWVDRLAELRQQTDPEYLSRNRDNISGDEVVAMQAELNNMTSDPMFNKFMAGVAAQQNAFKAYKKAAGTPEYARYLADIESSRAAADKSVLFKGTSAMGQVTGPVIAGIAALPRTVISALGVKEMPVVDDLADWADEQTRFIESQASLGSKADMPLWTNMTQYKGMQVEVDAAGRPIAAYQSGEMVDMADEDVKAFIEQGAANTAKMRFNGWENAGFSTVKTLANLYLMRNLGGGTALGTGATSFTITYNDLYNEAIDELGYSATEAAQYAIANASVQGAVEASLGKIDVSPLRLQAARAFGVKEAKALIGKSSAFEVGQEAGKRIMREVLEENGEELAQTASDHLITALFNAKSGGDIERETSIQDLAETMLLTTATTLIASGGDSGRLGARSAYNNALIAAAENPAGIAPVIEEMIASGHLAADRAPLIAARLQKVAAANAALPRDMDTEERSQVLALSLHKAVLEESIQQTEDKGQQAYAKQAMSTIDEQIESVTNPPEAGPDSSPQAAPAVVLPVDEHAETTDGDVDEDIAEDVVMTTTEAAPMAVVINEDTTEPSAMENTVLGQPVEAAPIEGGQQVESDYSAFVSPDVQPFLEPSDRRNITEWVNESLSDPEEAAQYDNEEAHIQAAVSEYETTILQQKYAGRIRDKKKKKPDTPTGRKKDKRLPGKAQKVVSDMAAEEVPAVVQTLEEYTNAAGEVDIDRLESDIDSGTVSVPESIKQIVKNEENQTNEPGRTVPDQRAENSAVAPESSATEIPISNAKPGRPGRAGNVAGPEVGTAPPAGPLTEIDQRLKGAPLPDIDEEVLTEMLSDGLIDVDTFDNATAFMEGSITEETSTAYEAAMAAREGLRTPVDRQMVSNSSGVLIQRRSDGVIEVQGTVGAPETLLAAGATYNPVLDRYEATPDNEVAVLNAVAEQMVDEEKDGDSPVMGVNEARDNESVKAMSRTRRAKYKGAASFNDRLDIARAEHGTRKTVADKKAMQRVLNKLKKSLPGIKINTNAQDFADKLAEVGASMGLEVEYRGGIPGFVIDGRWEAPAAFVSDGQVYLNPDLAHPDTAIHEYGHIWNSWLKQNNEPEYNRGAALAKDSPYLDAVRANPLYASLSEEEQIEEALAMAIGDAGRMMLDMTPTLRFKGWLDDVWSGIERTFRRPRMREMTLQQWADDQAHALLSGIPTTRVSGKQIAREESNRQAAGLATTLERMGVPADQINAITGARRQADGSWLVHPIQFRLRFDERSRLPARTTVRALIDSPTITAAFPDWDYPVVLDINNTEPIIRNGAIHMAPVVDPAYIAKAISLAQQTMPTPARARSSTRFMASQNHTSNPVPGSVDYESRMLSARQVIAAEIQQQGMKDYDKKSRQLADALGLQYQDVLYAWEQAADQERFGRMVIPLGDAKSMGEGKWGQFKEAYQMRKEVAAERISIFINRWFTVKGLFPPEIKLLAEARASRIAGRMVEARYILNDLESAMKEDYGKTDEVHWRLVDNVLRGTADWEILPPNVRVAAMAMRKFTDSLSQELITSGATNGKAILTILNNSGVAATAENMIDWNGVNLFDALDKLPYERSAAEDVAIKAFLAQQQTAIGSYFFRSYRKHKDKEWSKKVPPRVLADAREFIRQQLIDKMSDIESVRDERQDKLEAEQARLESLRLTRVEKMKDDLAAIESRIVDLSAAEGTYLHTKGKPSAALEKQRKAAEQKAQVLIKNISAADAVNRLDIEVVMDLSEADLNAMSADVRRIVRSRQKQYEIQEKLDNIGLYKQGAYDTIVRILNTPPGVQGGIDGIIYNHILHVDEVSGSYPTAKLGSKDLGFLKQRKDIPVPIRDLMGEFHDARINFVQSTMNMINTIEDQIFLTELRSQFEGEYFFPPEAYDMGVQISSPASGAMSPLNGWHTTKEIKIALDDYYQRRMDFPAVIAALRYVSDMVKYGKTILSPVTHFRNFFANGYFVVQNGYLPRDFAKSGEAFKNAWNLSTDEQHREYIIKLTKLGVIGSGASTGDIKAVIERTSADSLDSMTASTIWQKSLNAIQNTYTAEDDFFRIMAFEAEKRRYSSVFYGKKHEDLTPDQQADVERHSADLVDETMPTYSKVPQAIRFLREVPLFGTFVAFPAEMFRITYNQVKRVATEMNDPRTRGVAVARMIGMSLAQGLPMALVALGRHFVGVSAEEESAARYFTPEWQQSGMWMWDSFERGESMSFRNLAYSDPYAFYKKPILSMMTGNHTSIAQAMGDGAWSLLSPFLDVELTTGTILALAFNKNPQTGAPIYNPGAGVITDWRSFRDFTWRQLQPGAVKFGWDVSSVFTGEGQFGRPPKEWDDVVLNMVGLATEKNELQKSAMFKIKSIKKSMEYSKQYFSQNKRKYENDPSGMDGLYERTESLYNDGLKELSLCIENMQKIGIPSNDMIMLLRDQNVSKKEITAAMTGVSLSPKFKGYNAR